MIKKRKKKKKLSKSAEPKSSLTNLDYMHQNAALVVHERVIMVAPNITMTRHIFTSECKDIYIREGGDIGLVSISTFY